MVYINRLICRATQSTNSCKKPHLLELCQNAPKIWFSKIKKCKTMSATSFSSFLYSSLSVAKVHIKATVTKMAVLGTFYKFITFNGRI